MLHSFQCLSDSCGIITTLEQSPAVDTVAVGTSTGSVHLINTLHDVQLFSLHHKGKQLSKKSSPVNAVSSISFRTDGNATRQGVAPLAVGCDDGSVSVWDLTPVEDDNDGTIRRTLLTQMEATHHGGVSKLQYLPGEPLLLSTGMASNSVLLHVFDAPDHSGRILRQRKGHTSPPSLLRYLHPGVGGGGILANASDGTDAASCQILSCGGPGDLSLRLFSTARTNLDKEYSQGPGLERKAKKLGLVGPEGRAELLLPEVAGLATSEARSRDWGDLVTIHKDHAMAYVWSTNRGSQTGPVLRQPQWNVSIMKTRPPRSAHATSVAISACGNFALVGTVGGIVYKYNIQSGIPRGSFPRDATSLTEEEERRRKKGIKVAGDVGRTMRMLEKNSMKGGVMPSDIDQAERDRISFVEAEAKRNAIIKRASHEGAVVGIAIDSLNKTVVTAGSDSKLVLWNFVTHMPNKKSPIMLPSPATKLTHVRDSDLAAIAMRDFGVAVFDCSSLSIVRYFGGSRYASPSELRLSHTGPISDMGFGPDGRKLFTSSLDGTIRVWDVPTGLCVDWSKLSFALLVDVYRSMSSIHH
jgi:U3 small nucleolar RNA-associated protein 21